LSAQLCSAQQRGHPLGDVYRAIAATTAEADGDRKGGFTCCLIARQPRARLAPQPGEKRLEIRISLDMGGDRVPPPRLQAKLGNTIWIVEKVHIEDQIGIRGMPWRYART